MDFTKIEVYFENQAMCFQKLIKPYKQSEQFKQKKISILFTSQYPRLDTTLTDRELELQGAEIKIQFNDFLIVNDKIITFDSIIGADRKALKYESELLRIK